MNGELSNKLINIHLLWFIMKIKSLWALVKCFIPIVFSICFRKLFKITTEYHSALFDPCVSIQWNDWEKELRSKRVVKMSVQLHDKGRVWLTLHCEGKHNPRWTFSENLKCFIEDKTSTMEIKVISEAPENFSGMLTLPDCYVSAAHCVSETKG